MEETPTTAAEALKAFIAAAVSTTSIYGGEPFTLSRPAMLNTGAHTLIFGGEMSFATPDVVKLDGVATPVNQAATVFMTLINEPDNTLTDIPDEDFPRA